MTTAPDDEPYALLEELLLRSPVPIDFETVCDRRGCLEPATLLVPGAALCHACGSEFGIERLDRYQVPLRDLAFNDDWREIRREQYDQRLAELHAHRPRRRTPRADRLIAENIEIGLQKLTGE